MVRRGAAPGAPASPMACREPFPTSPLRSRVPHRSRPSAPRSGIRRRPGGRAWFRRSAFQCRMMPSPDGGCPQDRARRTSSRASTGSWPGPPGMRGPETTKGSMPTYSEPASIAACMTSAATSFSAAPARMAARWIPAFAGMTGEAAPRARLRGPHPGRRRAPAPRCEAWPLPEARQCLQGVLYVAGVIRRIAGAL